MSLNPIGQGQEVTLSLSIEALALPNADREAELTTLVSEQLAQADVRDYQLIAHRNFFSSGGTDSAWKQIQLSAITSDVHGVGEAWFNVGAGQQDTDPATRSDVDDVLLGSAGRQSRRNDRHDQY